MLCAVSARGHRLSRTFLLALLLMLGNAPAWAGWVLLAHNEQSVIYIETPLPRKAGGNVMIWVLRDHLARRQGPGGPHASSKDQLEIDCAGRRIRRLYSSDHPQPMGAGKPVHFEHGPMSWNFATANSIASRMVNVAC